MGPLMVSKPESLSKEHILSSFDCGKEPLNSWLHKYALQNQNANHTKTMVFTQNDSKIVVGYYSYNVISVEHVNSTPERVSKDLAKHPIPVLLIARLAIDQTHKGQGLGKRLFRAALKHAITISTVVPIRAVIVDALDEETKAFYTAFDFESFPSDSFRMWLLMKDLLNSVPH
jgi:predicted N-acetyltransferase YhbS